MNKYAESRKRGRWGGREGKRKRGEEKEREAEVKREEQSAQR